MISTNTTHPKTEDTEGKKLRVMTSNKITPKEYDFSAREFPGMDKRQMRKVAPGMLTMENLEERARIAKRSAAAEAKRAIKTVQVQATPDLIPEKKKAGRPRKA